MLIESMKARHKLLPSGWHQYDIIIPEDPNLTVEITSVLSDGRIDKVVEDLPEGVLRGGTMSKLRADLVDMTYRYVDR